jgi:hypothetical protein
MFDNLRFSCYFFQFNSYFKTSLAFIAYPSKNLLISIELKYFHFKLKMKLILKIRNKTLHLESPMQLFIRNLCIGIS